MQATDFIVFSLLAIVVNCDKDEDVFCKPNRSFAKKVESIVEMKLKNEISPIKDKIAGFEKYKESEALSGKATAAVLELIKERLRAVEEKTNIHPQLYDCPKSGMSGIYVVHGIAYPHGLRVYCDTETDGGGWVVFQRRKNGKLDFDKNWDNYVKGFGQLSDEFWLGFDTMTKILSNGNYELRIDIEDWEGEKAYASYKTFSLGDSSDNYKLTASGYSGTAGDSLDRANAFTTKDKDNDTNAKGNCAVSLKGGWWFSNCNLSNLNGKYYKNGVYSVLNHEPIDGVSWYHWKGTKLYSMKMTEMKFRLIE